MPSNEQTQPKPQQNPKTTKSQGSSDEYDHKLFCQWVEIKALLYTLERAWATDPNDQALHEATPTLLQRLRSDVEAIEC